MEDNNPSLPPNNHVHANATNNPFMQNLPFPHVTTQNHVLNNDSAIQDHTSWNHTLVPQVTPESFVPPRIYHHYQGSGFGNSLPGLEDIESALGGLSLRHPFRNSVHSLGQSSGSNGSGPNNFLSQPVYQNSGSNGNGSGYVHDYSVPSLGQSSGSNGFGPNNFLSQPVFQNSGSNGNGSGYVHDYSVPSLGQSSGSNGFGPNNFLSQPVYQNSGSNGNGSGYVHDYSVPSLGQSSGSNGFGPNNFLSQHVYQNSGSNGNGSGYVHDYIVPSLGQSSGSNGFGPNNFLSQHVYQNSGSNGNGSGYVHDYETRSLLQERIDAAAAEADAEQRVQAASYSRSVPDFSNSMSNRYLNHQMSNEISYMPHGNGVNGLGNYYDDDRHDYSFLEGMRGEVLSMAKDNGGSRFLQLIISEGPAEVAEMVLSEVKDHIHELMTHQYGNYLIQKIFKLRSVSDDKKNFIVDSIIHDVHMLRHVCMDDNGTRVIQRMVENVRTLTRMDEITNVMMQITVPLMKNANGGYVIQQCVKVFPEQYQWKILYVVALNCIDIATNKSGCSFIQKCMDHAQGTAMVPLVQAIICYAALLAEDPYGNYVVNYLVKLEILKVNGMIVLELQGKYVQLSRNKHASNVVQNLLKCSEEKDAKIIILELMHSPEFCSVLQDRFGNYVAQTALEISKGNLHKRLVESILAKYRNLCSHLYGKNVLAFIDKGRKIQF